MGPVTLLIEQVYMTQSCTQKAKQQKVKNPISVLMNLGEYTLLVNKTNQFG